MFVYYVRYISKEMKLVSETSMTSINKKWVLSSSLINKINKNLLVCQKIYILRYKLLHLIIYLKEYNGFFSLIFMLNLNKK